MLLGLKHINSRKQKTNKETYKKIKEIATQYVYLYNLYNFDIWYNTKDANRIKRFNFINQDSLRDTVLGDYLYLLPHGNLGFLASVIGILFDFNSTTLEEISKELGFTISEYISVFRKMISKESFKTNGIHKLNLDFYNSRELEIIDKLTNHKNLCQNYLLPTDLQEVNANYYPFFYYKEDYLIIHHCYSCRNFFNCVYTLIKGNKDLR